MDHHQTVLSIQKQIQDYQGSAFLALKRYKGHSNTTRSKSYNNSSQYIDAGPLDKIIFINKEEDIVRVQPKVTMDALVRALLPLGYGISIIPELKGITVGGAIMGAAAESGSFKEGIFSDLAVRYELISGQGDSIIATPDHNSDLFYALPGSYGTFGLLVSVDIKIRKMHPFVEVHAIHFSDIESLINSLRKNDEADFVDGFIFSKNHGVLVKTTLNSKRSSRLLKESFFTPWFFQYIAKNSSFQMSLYDYFFRLDRGAFWMGAYLLQWPLLKRFIIQGIYNISPSKAFSHQEIKKFHKIDFPSSIKRFLSYPFMNSQRLWSLLHKAEEWVQNRFIIQDFCIPESQALLFIQEAIEETEIFPLWLCPIKSTKKPQIFAPHLFSRDEQLVNIGIYGMPSTILPVEEMTRHLEKKTQKFSGRKVLYSRSYYTEEEFWDIYSRSDYEKLRLKTKAIGRWPEITTKVLST